MPLRSTICGAALADAVAADDARLRGLRDGLQAQAREWLSPRQRQRLEGTEANLALLGDRLRMLEDGAPAALPQLPR